MAGHVIYLPWVLARNAGGPSGYLWHLREGLASAGLKDEVRFLIPENSQAGQKKRSNWKAAIDKLRPTGLFWRTLKSIGPTNLRRDFRELVTASAESLFLPADIETALHAPDITGLHCHATLDAVRADNSLRRIGRRDKVKLFLTSHCPEMPALEKLDLMINAGLLPWKVPKTRERLLSIDIRAFANADVLIFPSEESLEPYFETGKGFADAIKGKNVRYVLTGIVDVPKGETPQARPGKSKLNLVYVGRHNAVKGYDLLIKAVLPFLDRVDASICIAGAQGPLFAPTHPRWAELGWISNPRGVIEEGDIFVLPNRRTYFDLAALEVLALGKPLLASATGGNKTLAAIAPGVILFEPSEAGLSNALDAIAAQAPSALKLLGAANRAAFEVEFTAEAFAHRYVSAVKAHQ